MVAIFKTDVIELKDAEDLSRQLRELYPNAIISFDLDDTDNILRVETRTINTEAVTLLLNSNNFTCIELPVVF